MPKRASQRDVVHLRQANLSAGSSPAMETVAVSNVGAPVELAMARAITRLATYRHLDAPPPSASMRPTALRGVKQELASLDMPTSESGTIPLARAMERSWAFVLQRHSVGEGRERNRSRAIRLPGSISTTVIWPAVAAGFPPTSRRRDRAADRPRIPGRRSAAGRARRRRLTALWAQLPAEVERSRGFCLPRPA